MDPNQSQDQNQPQQTPKQQVVERVRSANNVLVTVKSNPNVDELAAAIGLTLMLNKLGKHATAVFSGEVPSTLEFLKPEETIETNTDSLRDFIVSLDKSKADKLRYKVEENVVKIFITPYKTSISQDDLEFTQGDFNVDAVMALGVTQREELDQAITAHGRILHDATVVTVTAGQDYSELGQINWQEQAASSLSEMLVSISEAFENGLIDTQIATAFLTGIVSETERFSNTKTTPKVMTMSAQLMAAGANQQLIANELEKVVEVEVKHQPAPSQQPDAQPDGDIAISEDGTLSINHEEQANEPGSGGAVGQPNDEPQSEEPPIELPEPQPEEPQPEVPLTPPSENKFGKFLAPQPQEQQPDSFEPMLEPEKPEPAPQPADPPGAPHAQTDADDGQIHIDVEGNMMRKAAAEPKHKVIQPLPDEPEAPEPVEDKEQGSEPILPPLPGSDQTQQPPVSQQSDDTQAQGSVARPDKGKELPPPPVMDMTPPLPIQDNTTIQEIEESVGSHHQTQADEPSLHSARDAVVSALGQDEYSPAGHARNDLHAMPFGAPPASTSLDSFRLPDAPQVSNAIDPSTGSPPVPAFTPSATQGGDSQQMTPPPVPPPMTSL